jgi:KipI family sensor histidine kinase inhibitor
MTPETRSGPRILQAGDATLIVELGDRIDPAINAAAIALAQAVRAARISGVRDVVPTYRSVAVHFDPLRTDGAALLERIRAEASTGASAAIAPAAPIRVPVRYGGDFGPDLAAVARFAGTTESDVVRLHTSRTYRVFMLGFVPGFTYMGTVDPRIAAPRLAVPRVSVPAGSVGIAGAQTGIYPESTPGGWQIIGHTSLKPFDPDRLEPFLFKPGDTVQFVANGSEADEQGQNS